MDEAQIAADLIARNVERIWNLGKRVYGQLEGEMKIKMRTAYTDYLENTKAKYSKSKSFFIRDQPVDLYSYYVPVGVQCGKKKIDMPSYRQCINVGRHIVFSGMGGCGKSVLMRHLFLDCLNKKEHIPVLIELRDLNNGEYNLEELISLELSEYGFTLSKEFIDKSKLEGHFAYFFDGFDEVNHSLRKKLIANIKSMLKKYRDSPMFISTRPEDVFNGIDEFHVFNTLPLEKDKAIELVKKLPADSQIKSKFIGALEGGLFEQHSSFLSNPLLLSIMLLTYGENAEIPNKLSIFYNQAYEALFHRHDANKGGYKRSRLTNLDIQDFGKIFSLFALQTYEKRVFKMPRSECIEYIENSKKVLNIDFESECYLNDLLSAACLLIEDGLEIAYSHRSFQEYFVARFIYSASPEMQDKLINKYWKNSISDNVIQLLTEMNQELIERVLLIPNLEKLFNKIGITKKVGISHAAKYVKEAFDDLILENGSLSARWYSHHANIAALVDMAARYSPTSIRFDSTQNEKFTKHLSETYGTKESRIEFPTSKMTYRTPFLSDILKNSQSFLSIQHLQNSYDGYNALKRKHAKQNRTFKELIGF